MLCGDGRLLTLHLDAEGQLAKRLVSEPFFNPDVDPIMPNGSDINGVWYFPSYDGMVYPVDLSKEVPTFGNPWPLGDEVATDEAEAERWMPGGPLLLMGSNPPRNELYVLMHPVSMSQGVGDFGFPGTEVWVFDAERQVRVRRQALRNMATNIFVTADEKPLLLASVIDPERYVASEDGVQKVLVTVEVYDAVTGEYLRRFSDPGAAIVRMRAAPGSNEGVTP
jgi:methylamine dehydrogenase heavy chain